MHVSTLVALSVWTVVMMERFFISGCQRSGTTMLRLILESHPFIQCFDEVAGYDILIHESKGEVREFAVKEGASLNWI